MRQKRCFCIFQRKKAEGVFLPARIGAALSVGLCEISSETSPEHCSTSFQILLSGPTSENCTDSATLELLMLKTRYHGELWAEKAQ
jgi:hypothetical protein